MEAAATNKRSQRRSRQLFDDEDYYYDDDYYADDPPPAPRVVVAPAPASRRRPPAMNTLASRRQALAKRRLNLSRRIGSAASSQQYGSFSGHKTCDNGIPLALLLTTLLGIGVLFFILFTKITMATGRRRKRSEMSEAWEQVQEGFANIDADGIYDLVYGGRSTRT